jgi:hypothetical protein
MKLTLKRFYQAVDLDNPDKVTYYLVLVTDAGKEVLLPVQKETTEALVRMLYDRGQEESEESSNELENDSSEDQSEVGHEEEDEYLSEETESEELEEDELEGDELDDDDLGPAAYAAKPAIVRREVSKNPQTPISEDDIPSL